jgi:hypothetical protein
MTDNTYEQKAAELKATLDNYGEQEVALARDKLGINELEKVVHDAVAKLVGHAHDGHHTRLYQWYETVKARIEKAL